MNARISLIQSALGLCLALSMGLCAPCQAADEMRVETRDETRVDAFNQSEKAMGLYYQKPDPNILVALCYGLSQIDAPSFRERIMPTAAFFAPIFQAHPEQAEALVEDVAEFSDTTRSVLALAVSFADMPEREKLIKLFLPPQDQSYMQELIESPPLNVLELPLDSTTDLAILLSNFWATGEAAPIEHLISGLAFVNRTDIPYSIIVRQVQYLLMAQAVLHPRILEIMRSHVQLLNTENPSLAAELHKVIARAETELSNIAQAETAFAAREAELVDGESFLDEDFSEQNSEDPNMEEWNILND